METDNENGLNTMISPAEPTKCDATYPYWINKPWTLSYYMTIRGSENFHIYLWIAKDICWAQDNYALALIFGSLAVAWLFLLAYHTYLEQNLEELYMLIALSLWLFGNFWWMVGEVVNGDDDIDGTEAGHIFEAAIAMLLLYHLVLKPFGIIKPDLRRSNKYLEAGLVPRFSYFQSWRQYENAHTFCWLGKDLSWNTKNPYTWVLCVIPTISIGVDFIWTTWHTKHMTIECMHYIAQLLWVLGNFTWAFGELFYSGQGADDYAIFMFYGSDRAYLNARWWAAWVLFCAFVPIVILYCLWLPLTATGRLDHLRKGSSHIKNMDYSGPLQVYSPGNQSSNPITSPNRPSSTQSSGSSRQISEITMSDMSLLSSPSLSSTVRTTSVATRPPSTALDMQINEELVHDDNGKEIDME